MNSALSGNQRGENHEHCLRLVDSLPGTETIASIDLGVVAPTTSPEIWPSMFTARFGADGAIEGPCVNSPIVQSTRSGCCVESAALESP